MYDLRYAVRQLVKNPGFSILAVLALALGIGANSALFSVVNRVLLSPLPFKNASRLVMVHSIDTKNEIVTAIPFGPVSGPDFLDFREQSESFEGLAVCEFYHRVNLNGLNVPLALNGAKVTPSFFEVFGIPMRLGRGFRSEEAEPGNTQRLILSEGIWKRHFGSDTNVLGRTVRINDEPFEVVGVRSKTFGFLDELAEVYVPMPRTQLEGGSRGSRYLLAFGHLKPAVTMDQASAELNTIAAVIAKDHPKQKGLRVRLGVLQEDLVKMARPALLVLHGAVGFVLLIACVNVANLLLARAQVRGRELAIRASMGASRLRVIRQLLTESILLSCCGGALGLAIAHWGVRLILAMSPKIGGRSIPFFAEIGLDGRVLGYTLLITLLTGVLVGLVPAWRASNTDLGETLKEAGRSGDMGFRRHRLLGAFVVSQVALSMILLVSAGLMIKSYFRLTNVDPGFDPYNLLTLVTELPNKRYDSQSSRLAFFNEISRRVEKLPGVEALGLINILPMGEMQNNLAFEIEGAPPLPIGKYNVAEHRVANPDYFDVMRIPFKEGRAFTSQDDGDGLPVLIINESLARRFFPNKGAVGRKVKILGGDTVFEIVGIVGDEKFFGLGAEIPPIMYRPIAQNCSHLMSLAVRTNIDPMSLAPAVRQAIWSVDKDQPVTKLRPMEALVSESISVPRFAAMLLSGFAVFGLLLSAIGLYGVLAYIVSQRTHDIGVRMALGAQMRDIIRMTIMRGIALAGIGLGIGLLCSLALSRLMQGLLHEMNATDPLTLIGVALLLGSVALLACYLPARRAARVDPIVALRYN